MVLPVFPSLHVMVISFFLHFTVPDSVSSSFGGVQNSRNKALDLSFIFVVVFFISGFSIPFTLSVATLPFNCSFLFARVGLISALRIVEVSAKQGRVHKDNAIKIDAMCFMDKILSLSMGYIISFFVIPRNDKK